MVSTFCELSDYVNQMFIEDIPKFLKITLKLSEIITNLEEIDQNILNAMIYLTLIYHN